MPRCAAVITLVMTFLLGPSTPAAPAQTEVGEAFPDLVLPTVDGQQTVRLSDHRGRRVLLIEFASW